MNKVPLIYLDDCWFNRPFDDQSQVKIRLDRSEWDNNYTASENN